MRQQLFSVYERLSGVSANLANYLRHFRLFLALYKCRGHIVLRLAAQYSQRRDRRARLSPRSVGGGDRRFHFDAK